MNALAPLTDSETVLKDLRDTYLFDGRETGQLQAREVEITLGRLAAPKGVAGAARPLNQIHAEVAKAFGQDRTVWVALRDARERAVAIQTLVSERAGTRGSFDVKPLVQCLDSLLEVCEGALGSSTTPAGAGTASGDISGVSQQDGTALLLRSDIRTRDEAVRALDLVCDFLERHEPSNPAPLFIRRAQRLMTKTFVEIVKDLIPDSLANLEKLAGLEKEKK
ncbi:MAG: hypothetical protein DMD81_13065 [Candidatus Rokuibacteriota bacterium]|nr:MAG: hypothetical protein DMD81_13065 [Candidatus Rokubacteria bacterium]